MAFSHGKSTKVYVNGYDLTLFLQSISPQLNADTAEVSTFGLTHKKFVPGMKDATLQAEGFFDGAAASADVILTAALAGSGRWTWYPAGDAAAASGYGAESLVSAFNSMTTKDDAARISAAAQTNTTGAESVVSLHAMGAEEESNWTGTTVNNGAASANGGSAYLQVTAATGTIEVSIRHSSDNFAADDDELVAFTAVTGRVSERKTFTGAVKQYVRGIAAIGGGETITFNIGIHRD